MTVGLYDPQGEITPHLRMYLPDSDIITVSSSTLEAPEGADPKSTHFVNKGLLLERSTHVIISLADIESLSMLSGALRRLLEGNLAAVMAVGSAPPLEFLYKPARDDGTEAILEQYLKNGKFTIVQTFDASLLKAFLAWR